MSDDAVEAVEAEDARLISLLTHFDTNSLAIESDLNTQMLNAQPQDVPRQREAMRALKLRLSAEERRAKAEAYKTLANTRFSAGHNRVAASGYLAGLFMLRATDSVPCPTMVASHLLGLDEVAGFLQGSTFVQDPPSALRTALQLNLAAAALKLQEWHLATAACEAALVDEPENAKALFRLAKAFEGAGNVDAAAGACERLLAAQPDNADGRKLLDLMRRRERLQARMFKGCFDRARDDNAEGDGLYTAAQLKREKDEHFDARVRSRRRCAPAWAPAAHPSVGPPRPSTLVPSTQSQLPPARHEPVV